MVLKGIKIEQINCLSLLHSWQESISVILFVVLAFTIDSEEAWIENL